MIKRILVGLAGTIHTPVAIQHAVALAQTHGAEVTGVTVLDARRIQTRGPALATAARAHSNREARLAISQANIAESVREFEAACSAAQLKHGVVAETGDPFAALTDLARYHDLMVFGLKSVFEYDFLAGPPESLLIQLVGAGVRPLLAASDHFRDVARVLIAYNGSMESAKAMKRFVQMRLWPHAALKLVTFHPSVEQAYELLRHAEAYCRAHGFQVCHDSNPGDPQTLLLTAATLWQADLIVMGNSARSILVRKVLGDTLLATLRGTKIPLFLAQ